MVVFGNLYFTK